SKDICEYVITDKGVVIGDPLDRNYVQQLTTGIPDRIGQLPSKTPPEPNARAKAKR
ncbi:MAG: hypothetical protein H0T42_04465, partial [Deltaproteobacteria bacterium]|nr:hypothetical protein [Deltaproteobacteria bacterium]